MARNYESVAGDKTNKYRFTSKERDKETIGSDFMNVGYDYFGARYYNSRIGRWGSVEPLYNQYLSVTPYNYTLNNPIRLLDEDGKGPRDGDKNRMYGDPGIIGGSPSGGIAIGVGELVKDIVGYGGSVILGIKTWILTSPDQNNQVQVEQEKIVKDKDVSMQEQIEQADDVIIARLESKAKGKENVKLTELEGKSVEEVQEALTEAKKEGDKQKVKDIIKHLKGMKQRNIQSRGGKTRFEAREDPNN